MVRIACAMSSIVQRLEFAPSLQREQIQAPASILSDLLCASNADVLDIVIVAKL